jgi:TrpR family trp operon transcriptional repressor
MESFKSFINLIVSTTDKDLLEDFLLGITTTNERHVLLQRVEIVRRLIDNQPQLKIAKDLGVGIATVTRGSKELATGRLNLLKRTRS